MPNATSAHVEGIVHHNLDRIEARQAIRLSDMAEEFVLPLQRMMLMTLHGAI